MSESPLKSSSSFLLLSSFVPSYFLREGKIDPQLAPVKNFEEFYKTLFLDHADDQSGVTLSKYGWGASDLSAYWKPYHHVLKKHPLLVRELYHSLYSTTSDPSRETINPQQFQKEFEALLEDLALVDGAQFVSRFAPLSTPEGIAITEQALRVISPKAKERLIRGIATFLETQRIGKKESFDIIFDRLDQWISDPTLSELEEATAATYELLDQLKRHPINPKNRQDQTASSPL